MYECQQFIASKLPILLSQAAQYKLTDVQSYINFKLGNYMKSL
jgi:hypothetical protein